MLPFPTIRRSPSLSGIVVTWALCAGGLCAGGCTAYLEADGQTSPSSVAVGSGTPLAGVGGSLEPSNVPQGVGGSTTSAGGATGGLSGSGGDGSLGVGGSALMSTGGQSTGSGGTTDLTDSGPPCKRGISFDRWADPQPTAADLDVLSSSLHWFYNWHHTKNPSIQNAYLSRGFEWVPMTWDGGFNVEEAHSAITADVNYLLGFNEPNIRGMGGVDMTVEEVVALWPSVQGIADAHDLELVSPAVTFTNIPGERNGPEWLQRFFQLCPTCRVDAIAMHTYTCEARWVADHLEPYRQFGLPIWVTEFACFSDDTNLIRTFMQDTVALLENDPDVARYAWFMSRAGNTSILGGSGQLTSLGELYVSLPEAKPCASL